MRGNPFSAQRLSLKRLAGLHCFVLLALLASNGKSCLAGPQSGYQQGWNTSGDFGGWEPNTTVTSIAVVGTGGNPGGYLSSSGTAAGSFDIGVVTRIPQVTGDFRGSIWSASVDVKFVSGNFDSLWIRFRYKDSTENGWVVPLTASFPLGSWQSYTVILDPNWTDVEARARGWRTDSEVVSPGANPSQTWSTTMSNVYTMEVRISGEGLLQAGIDNVRLHVLTSPFVTPSSSYCPRVEYLPADYSWRCHKD
jgi:hypothetical protein